MRNFDLDSCKKLGKPEKTWDQSKLNDNQKLVMVCADPLNRYEWEG